MPLAAARISTIIFSQFAIASRIERSDDKPFTGHVAASSVSVHAAAIDGSNIGGCAP